jgi:hypothetical protein
MIRLIPSLLLVLVIGCNSDLPTEPSSVEAAPPLPTVTRVIDGDTIVVEGVGTVRLIGVDTPETVDPRRPVQYFGKEASTSRSSLRQESGCGWSSIKTARIATAERWPTSTCNLRIYCSTPRSFVRGMGSLTPSSRSE